jgi:hypothetical protein
MRASNSAAGKDSDCISGANVFRAVNGAFKMGRRACGFGAETRTTAVSKDSDDFAEEARASFSVDVGEGGG